jgi:N-acyl-D-aspartate/D-glutamate deacylase
MQKVHGYDATIVSGHVTYRGGEVTGELPGRLVRGQQAELNVAGRSVRLH